jgi:D-alanine-D-alanine ligase
MFGGRSVEHEVSVISAHQSWMHSKWPDTKLLPVYIDKKGAWFAGKGLYKSQAVLGSRIPYGGDA